MKRGSAMARNKHPEVTVKRIIKSAEKLFLEKGYEDTTIQDIVDDLGDLSKGAIYHHFKSKEEIIDAVSTELYADVNFDDYVKDQPNGLAKLQKLAMLCVGDTKQRDLLASAPSLMKNPRMLVKGLDEIKNESAPMIMPYIEEGIRDGSIKTTHPRQAAEVFLILANIWVSPLVYSVEKEVYMEKILMFKEIFEGIGMPVVTDEMVEALKKYYRIAETYKK